MYKQINQTIAESLPAGFQFRPINDGDPVPPVMYAVKSFQTPNRYWIETREIHITVKTFKTRDSKIKIKII